MSTWMTSRQLFKFLPRKLVPDARPFQYSKRERQLDLTEFAQEESALVFPTLSNTSKNRTERTDDKLTRWIHQFWRSGSLAEPLQKLSMVHLPRASRRSEMWAWPGFPLYLHILSSLLISACRFRTSRNLWMNCRLTGRCDMRDFISHPLLERLDAYCLQFFFGIVFRNCKNRLVAQSFDAVWIDFEVCSPYKFVVFCKHGDGYCNKRVRFKPLADDYDITHYFLVSRRFSGRETFRHRSPWRDRRRRGFRDTTLTRVSIVN